MIPAVWAPLAERVELLTVDGDRHSLERDDESGWHRGGPDLTHGDRYAFSLDGGQPRPDPRSAWQPEGVDGPSAVDDPATARWTDNDWHGFHLPGSVLYELHIGTFSPEGTFDGAVERLDHLVDLGVDAIEVMPIAEFPGERGWGYDGVLLFAPHHRYGGPDGFRRLVDAAHARGLGVILDVVYNHFGPHGNHLGEFGPYLTDAHRTPWGAAVNLDGPEGHEVRAFIVANARHWFIDHHVDGLRLDAVHALADASALHLLEELADETAALAAHLGRPLWLTAESDRNDTRPVLPPEAGGWGIHAQWSDDLHHALHSALTGEDDGYYEDYSSLADVAAALERVHVIGGQFSPHRRRVHGRPAGDIDRHRFVVASQNHDQVGNRAVGERLAHLAGADRAMAAAAIVLCSPFLPMLFQGEEWAASTPFLYFCDMPDPELAEAIRTGRREEFAAFGWKPEDVPDPLDAKTFERSVLDWDEVDEGDHARVHAWYRSLLRLRREREDLTDGRAATVSVAYDDDQGWIVMRRQRTAVAVNTADADRVLPSSAFGEGTLTVLVISGDGVDLGPGGSVQLPPGATAVLATD